MLQWWMFICISNNVSLKPGVPGTTLISYNLIPAVPQNSLRWWQCGILPLSSIVVEKAMAPHSSALAWKIPWTEEPGGLQSMGSLRVRHDWVTSLSVFTFMHWRRKWQPTPVFLPGGSQGRGSLVGCCLWGHTEAWRLSSSSNIAAICHLNQHRPRAPVLPRRWKHTQCWANLVKVRISWSIQWSSNLSIPSVASKLDKAPWRSLVLSLPTVICWDVLSSFLVSGHWSLSWLELLFCWVNPEVLFVTLWCVWVCV